MWISRGEYQRLSEQLDRAEDRLDEATAALATERAENRRAERHFANMLLRRAGTFPVPPVEKPPDFSAFEGELESVGPSIDPGELEAHVAEGAVFGLSAEEVEQRLRQQRGLEN